MSLDAGPEDLCKPISKQTGLRLISDLPLFDAWERPDFGSDLEGLAADLFAQQYRGVMRASDGGAVFYTNSDVRAMARGRSAGHPSAEKMCAHAAAILDGNAHGLTELLKISTFSWNPPEHLPNKQLVVRRLSEVSCRRFKSAAEEAIREQLVVVSGSEIEFLPDFVMPAVSLFWSKVLGVTSEESRDLVRYAGQFQLMQRLNATADELKVANEGSLKYIATLSAALEREAQVGRRPILQEYAEDCSNMGAVGRPDNLWEAFAVAIIEGYHTFGAAVANVTHSLLSAPEALLQVRANPSLASKAVAEGLRLNPAIILTQREALRDFEYDGIAIPKGSTLSAFWLISNRDPHVFIDPDSFRLDRDNRDKQTEFGGGVYACPGQNMARMFTEVAVRELTRRNVNIIASGPAQFLASSVLREISTMPIAIQIVD